MTRLTGSTLSLSTRIKGGGGDLRGGKGGGKIKSKEPSQRV